MHPFITPLFALLIALFAVTLRAEEPIQLSPDLEVYPLTSRAWVHRSWAQLGDQQVPSNGVVIVQPERLTLVDTAWDETATRALLDWIESRFGRAPDLAVITHSHDDRMGGVRVLAERGVPAWAHPRTLVLAQAQAEDGPHSGPLRAIDDFNRQPRVSLGSLELYYPGPAHSPDNIVAWFGEEQLLVGGCAVKSAGAARIGYVEGSDPGHWPQAMENLLAQFPAAEVVVPGHGQPGGRGLLIHTLDLASSERPVTGPP